MLELKRMLASVKRMLDLVKRNLHLEEVFSR